MAFSNVDRANTFKRMQEKEYDLFVIGGGITGCGIALDAATRGMSVCVGEMQDFAAGTSSRSTKLVHGGLRYLKQLEVGLVAEVGKEREIVYENGPHVTEPEWMMLPFYEGGTFGPISTSVGLRVYDFLAGVKKEERRSMLTKEEVIKKEPLIRKKGLKGGGYYVEYRTDDARLTIEVAKKAAEYGADLQNYAKVTELLYVDGKVKGVVLQDVLSGEEYRIAARKVINATGPWVDRLREMDDSKEGKTMALTKGVHVVIDQGRLPLKQAVYFDTEDGRMMFAIPRAGKTYVGTSDTFYEGDPEVPIAEEKERQYIINAINYIFPETNITLFDIESSWAGVRPLILEEGKDPSEISRKDEIWVSGSGLITIAGGKLTGYRKMAENVVDLVAKQFKKESYKLFGECQTKDLPISGGDIGGSQNMEGFIHLHAAKGIELGLPEKAARNLVCMYGSNITTLYDIISQNEDVIEQYGFDKDVFAKLEYAIQEEKVATPLDFFFRRTGALLFDIISVQMWKERVIAYMKDAFGWDEETEEMYKIRLDKEIETAMGRQDNTQNVL